MTELALELAPSAIEPSKMYPVTAPDGTRLVVFSDAEGNLSALEDRCSHARISLSRGYYHNGIVRCIAHGACFSTKDGAPICGPATRPVRSFALRREGGTLYVRVPGPEEDNL